MVSGLWLNHVDVPGEEGVQCEESVLLVAVIIDIEDGASVMKSG